MTQYLPIKYREFYFVLIQAKKTSKVPGPFFLGTQKYKALISLYLGHFSGCFLQESILRYEVMSPSGIKSTCVLLSYCIKELFFQAQWSSIFMQTQSICSIHQDTHCVISMELRARKSKQILMLLHLLYWVEKACLCPRNLVSSAKTVKTEVSDISLYPITS